ncbi:MAG: hypothetical protein QM696_10880 [Steroidobacteraceae bacterium]
MFFAMRAMKAAAASKASALFPPIGAEMPSGQAINLLKPALLVLTLLSFGASQGCSQAPKTQPSPAASAEGEGRDWTGTWKPIGPGSLVLITDSDGAASLPENAGRQVFEMRQPIPYNAEYQARYDKVIESIRTTGYAYDNSAQCLPLGMPRMMIIPYPIEIIVQPDKVIMIVEQGRSVRWIHTDGRKHTLPEDLDPGFTGESIGHWEGDTLVVDTIGIRGDIVFDSTSAPHSDALHITERIRRIDAKTLEDRLVIEDPKAFTKPWLVTRKLEYHPEMELQEVVCEPENRKFPGAPGLAPE